MFREDSPTIVGPDHYFSLCYGNTKEICVGQFSALLPGYREMDWNYKLRSALWFLCRNPGRRQGPRSRIKILLPEDSIALWCMVSLFLVIRKDKFMAMGPSLYVLILGNDRLCALSPCYHSLSLQGKMVLLLQTKTSILSFIQRR